VGLARGSLLPRMALSKADYLNPRRKRRRQRERRKAAATPLPMEKSTPRSPTTTTTPNQLAPHLSPSASLRAQLQQDLMRSSHPPKEETSLLGLRKLRRIECIVRLIDVLSARLYLFVENFSTGHKKHEVMKVSVGVERYSSGICYRLYNAMTKCVQKSCGQPVTSFFSDMTFHHRTTTTHRDFELQIQDVVAMTECT